MAPTRIQLSIWAMCAAAVAAGPAMAKRHQSHSHHHGKHVMATWHTQHGVAGGRHDEPPWTAARPVSGTGEACPGNGRSFECSVWPPPMYEDPDRKGSSSDGG